MKTGAKRIKLYLIAILCTLLWGSAIPTIKLGYSVFGISSSGIADKLLFAGVRFFGAGLIILIPYFIFSRNIKIDRTLAKNSVTLGIVQTAGQYFFMYIGLTYTTGVNASVFNALGTLLYIVFAFIIFRDERLSKAKIIGCIIGFSGILFNSLATQQMGLLSFKGDGFIIIANVCVAAGFLYSKHSVKSSDPFILTGMQMGIGGAILLILGIALGGRLYTVTPAGICLLLYLMTVSSVAFSLWTLLLKNYPSALVGMFNFLTPVFGTIFSFILSKLGFLDEASAFTVYTVLAIVCSAIGIFLSSIQKKSTKTNGKSENNASHNSELADKNTP